MITHHSKGENTLAALPMADTEDITKWMNTAIPALEGENQLNYCWNRVCEYSIGLPRK
jgi:hypothetical protein